MFNFWRSLWINYARWNMLLIRGGNFIFYLPPVMLVIRLWQLSDPPCYQNTLISKFLQVQKKAKVIMLCVQELVHHIWSTASLFIVHVNPAWIECPNTSSNHFTVLICIIIQFICGVYGFQVFEYFLLWKIKRISQSTGNSIVLSNISVRLHMLAFHYTIENCAIMTHSLSLRM